MPHDYKMCTRYYYCVAAVSELACASRVRARVARQRTALPIQSAPHGVMDGPRAHAEERQGASNTNIKTLTIKRHDLSSHDDKKTEKLVLQSTHPPFQNIIVYDLTILRIKKYKIIMIYLKYI
jgi:hypothetical protein